MLTILGCQVNQVPMMLFGVDRTHFNQPNSTNSPWADVRNPPPPWGISETYISKNLIPSAVQISLSALISRVRLPWRANWRSVPPSFSGWGWHFLSGGGMDTCNSLGYSKFVVLVKWSTGAITKYFSEAPYYYPWKKIQKTSQKMPFFCSFFENFHKL